MNLIPRNTLVAVVEIKEAETINDAGIVLPAQTRNTFKQAEVVSVGGGMDNNDEATRDLKPGYRVLVKLNKQSMRPGLGGEPVSSFEPIGIQYKDDQGRDITLVDQLQIVALITQ